MTASPTDVASSDTHQVGPWFAGKLDFEPKVRDLSAQGFPLIGARIDYFQGRKVAVLVYRRHLHTINVFVTTQANGFLRPGEFARSGFNIAAWSEGEFDYWAISDLNADELGKFAAELRAS